MFLIFLIGVPIATKPNSLGVALNKDLSVEYHELKPKYEKLSDNLKNALMQFLSDQSIDVFDVEKRVKTFDSFKKKISRRSFKKPFDEIEDICGIRIICYYQTDLEKINSIIKNELIILSEVDKNLLSNFSRLQSSIYLSPILLILGIGIMELKLLTIFLIISLKFSSGFPREYVLCFSE